MGGRVKTFLTVAVSALGLAACSGGDADATAADRADAAPAEESGEIGETNEDGTAQNAEGADTAAWPGDTWTTIDAVAAGLDPTVLEGIAAEAEAGLSNCLVVTRGGKLVDEWYWQGTRPDSAQEVWSASKSFTSVLMGMASDDGALSVHDRASEWIPEWEGTDSEEITVEQLLNNTSGRFQDYQSDYVEMAAKAADKTAFAIGLDQEFEPGSRWVYNNAAIQTLEQVFSGATGEDLADVAEDRLFAPLGMDDTDLLRDDAGNPMTFMGIRSTCRDMARFGLMALRNGEWNGEQVVSEDWMERSTGGPSQDLNPGYGWLWWLNNRGRVVDPSADPAADTAQAEEQIVPGAPEDMFFASGLGGQMVVVDPGSETVLVRLGPPVYPQGTDQFRRHDAGRVVTEAVAGPMTG